MRILVFIILFIGSSNYVVAQSGIQNYELIFGEDINVPSKEHHQATFGADSNGVYTISTLGSYNSGFLIYQFDSNFDVVKKKQFNLNLRKNNLEYTGVLELNGKIYLFTSYTNKKEKVSYLFKHEFDPIKYTLGDPKEVFRARFPDGPKGEEARFQFTSSANSKYVMMLSGIPSFKYEKNYFGLIVYDSNFDTVWNKNSIDIGHKNENYLEFRTDITNNGEAIVLAQVIDQSKRELANTIAYNYRMLVYGDREKPLIRELTVDNRYIMDAEFDIVSDTSINVYGYYSVDGWGQKGVFTWGVNIDSTLDNAYKEFAFPVEYITQFDSERAKSKAYKNHQKGKEIVFEDFEIRELIENSDSSFTLIGEMFTQYVSSHTAINSQISYTYHYVYGNIIIAKFNNIGELEWLEQIPKNQHTVNDNGMYSGFFATRLEDQLILVFNDHPLNNYKHEGESIDTWSGMTKYTDVVMHQIELEGKLERTDIFNGMNELVIARPSNSLLSTNSTLIIAGEDRKLFKLIGIKFE